MCTPLPQPPLFLRSGCCECACLYPSVYCAASAVARRYVNVFGESVLNDAVAMVMYDTLGGFVGSHFTPGRAVAGAQRSVGNLNTLLVHAIFRTSK